jgi:hypothetical protein
MLNDETRAAIPDQIRHGFLRATKLRKLNLGEVRCYQFDDFHTGVTLFSPDEQTCVYIQMYALPAGANQLNEDLQRQVAGKKWGTTPKEDVLKLEIFPASWKHSAFWQNPKRIVHLYQGRNQAVFIRYTGKSLRDSLLNEFNKNLRCLKRSWHTELVNHVLSAPSEDATESATIVDALDLRVEQTAIRKMILNGVKRFASNQRDATSDDYKLRVSGIILWFDVGNGYISVHFDVRAQFKNDGEYSHQEFTSLPRENWLAFVERLYDGYSVALTGLDGKVIRIQPESDLNVDEAFGLMMVQLLKSMRKEKAFAPLLIAPGAELMIEADDGAFSWPSHRKGRGKENRV